MMRTLLLLSIFPLFSACEETISGDEPEQITVIKSESVPDKRDSFKLYTPKPEKWIGDFDSVFSVAEEQKLNQLITAFERETGVEIAILTVDTAYVTKDSFYSLVYRVHNNWGIGKKEKDNGMTISICKDYGMFRITTGAGMQKMMSDKDAEKIMNDVFFPLLRENKFYDAFYKGTKEVITFLRPRAKNMD